MLKEIEIEYIDDKLISKIKEPLEKQPFVKSIKLDKENSLLSLTYEENTENYFGLAVISAVSLSLCVDYICYYSKYKNKEVEKNILLGAITSDSYYANTLLVTLVQYFHTNKKLKEKIFFKFNMNAFDKELDCLIEEFEFDNIMKKAKNDIHEILKENGINFKNYSTMQVIFDNDNCFSLKAKDGTLLSPENTYDVLGLDIEFEEGTDDFLTIITFCDLMTSVLGTKTLIIPKDCEDLYIALLEQQNIQQNKVKLVLKDV